MAGFRVLSPGLFTTIQDLGRAGRRAAGVPPGGAMDRFALVAANLLVGNEESAGALECALDGPVLVAAQACVVAITGGEFQPRLNGRAVDQWRSFFMAAGDELAFGGRTWGARCYVAVAGGFVGERWLGSVATYLLVGRGGHHGRPLKAGDELEIGQAQMTPAVVERELPARLRPAYGGSRLAAIPGPHVRRLTPRGRRTLFETGFRLSRDADRMGYRLDGPVLELKPVDLLSFGVTAGCIQVPASGQPILLMADHQTAGGYPVVAGVARADLPLAAQMLPGDEIGFREVSLEEAQALWRQLRAGLDTLRASPGN